MVFVALMATHTSAQERYVSTAVATDGVLTIMTAAGQLIVPAAEPEREFIGKPVGYDQIQISLDGRAVGWVVLYPNCCTSYPIPLALVIYSNGIKRSYSGNGLPVWKWRFVEAGSQVAFQQETVHGGLGVNYELRDVLSGALIADFSPPVGSDNQPLRNQRIPEWAAALDAVR